MKIIDECLGELSCDELFHIVAFALPNEVELQNYGKTFIEHCSHFISKCYIRFKHDTHRSHYLLKDSCGVLHEALQLPTADLEQYYHTQYLTIPLKVHSILLSPHSNYTLTQIMNKVPHAIENAHHIILSLWTEQFREFFGSEQIMDMYCQKITTLDVVPTSGTKSLPLSKFTNLKALFVNYDLPLEMIQSIALCPSLQYVSFGNTQHFQELFNLPNIRRISTSGNIIDQQFVANHIDYLQIMTARQVPFQFLKSFKLDEMKYLGLPLTQGTETKNLDQIPKSATLVVPCRSSSDLKMLSGRFKALVLQPLPFSPLTQEIISTICQDKNVKHITVQAKRNNDGDANYDLRYYVFQVNTNSNDPPQREHFNIPDYTTQSITLHYD